MEHTIYPYKSKSNIQSYWSDIQKIYEHIVDEKSKDIYVCRLLLAFTEDEKYIRKLVLSTQTGKEFRKFLDKQKEIYIYGAGIRGKRLVRMFPEMRWRKYIDKKCTGICNGIDIINPDALQLESDGIILITNYEGHAEIAEDLMARGIPKSQIASVADFETKAQENQYFEERCIKNFKNTAGVFIDAGCFDGRDCIRFMESSLNHNTSIYAFEPDQANYQNCKKALNDYKTVKVYNLGLSDLNKEEVFLSDKGEKARITSEGNCSINLDTIDRLMGDKQVGIIKMDIEGSEREALEGAREHIASDKPNMMISIYHKIEDAIEIPKLLLEVYPEYKFAFGHYSVGSASETVIYVFE